MARYIKANRLVAEFLHLENDRNKLNDGNYLLWQQDMFAVKAEIEVGFRADVACFNKLTAAGL